jgi:hypothetical protein
MPHPSVGVSSARAPTAAIAIIVAANAAASRCGNRAPPCEITNVAALRDTRRARVGERIERRGSEQGKNERDRGHVDPVEQRRICAEAFQNARLRHVGVPVGEDETDAARREHRVGDRPRLDIRAR